jgi:hypothetical protein
VKYSDVIESAFIIRNDCDYEDFYVISKNEVFDQIENTRAFLEAVKEYTTLRIQQN